jgi:hypothetical protein
VSDAVQVAAGIDVGNSTTEVVLGRLTASGVDVLGSARAPTRRAKGSPASLDGAVGLVRRLERAHGVQVAVAAAAPLRPVSTRAAMLSEPADATGRLRLVACGARTAAGSGWGVGPPYLLGSTPLPHVAVVALVPAGVGFAAAVGPLRELAERDLLEAVLVADDEGVLLGNRLGHDVPVVDEVPLEGLASVRAVLVEVRPVGTPLSAAADPLRLVSELRLDESEREDAQRLAGRLYDTSVAVVALGDPVAEPDEGATAWIELRGASGHRRVSFDEGHAALRVATVGAASRLRLPGEEATAVDDLCTVDLGAVADSVMARVGTLGSRAVALAALRADAPYVDPGPALSQRLAVPLRTDVSEPAAARLAALTTPGSDAASVVVDLGGGTVDVIGPDGHVVAAGGGELLTVSVAALSGATRAAAEWVKRGPASRVEAPQVLLAEDGSRQFLDRPAPPEAVGALTVNGPAGLLAFDRLHAPGEWRALRLRLKAEVLGGNVDRALRSLGVRPHSLVAVGGAAGDDEVLASLSRGLPDVAIGLGRAAGGGLGHRYAVAYGLLLHLAAETG